MELSFHLFDKRKQSCYVMAIISVYIFPYHRPHSSQKRFVQTFIFGGLKMWINLTSKQNLKSRRTSTIVIRKLLNDFLYIVSGFSLFSSRFPFNKTWAESSLQASSQQHTKCMRVWEHVLLNIYDFKRFIFMFWKWQSISIHVCEWAKNIFFFLLNVNFSTSIMRIKLWTTWKIIVLHVSWNCVSVLSSCCIYAIRESNTEKVLTYPHQKMFEMGSLKAIADNQHVKYVIFARYAQKWTEWEKKNSKQRQHEKNACTTESYFSTFSASSFIHFERWIYVFLCIFYTHFNLCSPKVFAI